MGKFNYGGKLVFLGRGNGEWYFWRGNVKFRKERI
jgi:hypothetical protein